MLLEVHFPAFVRLGQFGPHILSLEKQANRIGVREILCIPKKFAEWRARTGGDDIEGQAFHIFHAGIANFWVQPEGVSDFLQK